MHSGSSATPRSSFCSTTLLPSDLFVVFSPNYERVDFFALEFRVGQKAALIWADGQGNWGAGQWLPLSHPNADITCPPSPLSLQYFQGAEANASLIAAVERLAASK